VSTNQVSWQLAVLLTWLATGFFIALRLFRWR
jgi:hypothetical protein